MPGLDGRLHPDAHIQEENLKGGQTLARLSPLPIYLFYTSRMLSDGKLACGSSCLYDIEARCPSRNIDGMALCGAHLRAACRVDGYRLASGILPTNKTALYAPLPIQFRCCVASRRNALPARRYNRSLGTVGMKEMVGKCL